MFLKLSEKAVENENGFWFDPEAGFSKAFNSDKRYTSLGLRLCMVFSNDEKPLEYLLFQDNKCICASQKFDDVIGKADMILIKSKFI